MMEKELERELESLIKSCDESTQVLSELEPADNWQRQQIRHELKVFSELASLRWCRIFLTTALFVLIPFSSIGQSRMPAAFPTLLCYLFVYLLLSEAITSFARQGKSSRFLKIEPQEFLLKSLQSHYHYRYERLLTERFSFWSAMCLLALLQYHYSHYQTDGAILLTRSPVLLALLAVLLRYIGQWFLLNHLRRRLYSCK